MAGENRRIAVNTVWLYGRKALTMVVALYASRVLLEYLGVDDFGLYGLVGSIVLIFNSLRSMFAASVQRFLNVQKAGDTVREHRVFCVGMSVHIALSLLFAVAVEVAGMLMLPELNIAPERLSAAQWVLQFSILSAVVSILTVPYDAVLMAYEKFDAYALFSVIDSLLRLGVIFLIAVSPIDKVVFYSILLLGVALAVRLMNAIYCRVHFREVVRFEWIKDKTLFKEMTQFAGWNFFGNLGYSLTNEGVNLILNAFGGLVANAARTIAAQVNSALGTFTRDVNMTFVPQSMKAYADGNRSRFYSLQFISAKATLGVTLLLGVPVALLTPQILGLWLTEVPVHTVNFVRTILLYITVRSVHGVIDTAFKSANKLRNYQIAELSIMILNLPVSWVLLRQGLPLYWAFLTMSILETANLYVIMVLAHRELGFDRGAYVRAVLLPGGVLTAVAVALTLTLRIPVSGLWLTLGLAAAIALATVVVVAAVMLNREERAKILTLIRKR